MLRLNGTLQVWIGTFHFPPGLSVQLHEQEVAAFLKGRPMDGRPVLVQGDANAQLGWVSGAAGTEAIGLAGKSIMMLDQLVAAGFCSGAPSPSQFSTPTSCPRQEGRDGRQIDWGFTKGVLRSHLRIHQGSHMVCGTDHELLELRVRLRVAKGFRRHATRPRVWRAGPKVVDYLDQAVLVTLAKECTQPVPARAYVEPPSVRDAFRRAKLAKTPASWKQALLLRRTARRERARARLQRATEGDWQAFRDETRVPATGWDVTYAEAQRGDPHMSVHSHLSAVYAGQEVPELSPFEGPIRAFDVSELQLAVSQLRRGKSVGLGLTSRELLDGLMQIEGGKIHLLEFMNRILCTQRIPTDYPPGKGGGADCTIGPSPHCPWLVDWEALFATHHQSHQSFACSANTCPVCLPGKTDLGCCLCPVEAVRVGERVEGRSWGG